MSDDSPWSRVRKARLVQILAVYLGVCWVILQVVGELREALQLPAWIGPVSLILLAIGLVIILATAWVQSHPLVRHRAAADEVPGSWELALKEVKDSLARGEVPHLTWGRALLGGAFAFALLFGFAGLYVLIQDRGRSLAPTPAVADDAAPGIAVLPFTVSDPELEEWREGMVNLLSTNLDGVGGLRAIDSRTVLARWDELASGDARADLESSLAIARAAGARHALLGSVISAGTGVRLTADVYDVESGASLDRVRAEGPIDSIFSLVDRLSIETLQAILPDVEGEFSGVGLARVTTSSLPALRAFLEGEALFRRSRFDEAIPAYERAVEADPSFALASYRLSLAYGWAENISSQLSGAAIQRADRHSTRLPERERLLVRAVWSLFEGTLDGMESLRLAVRRFPDDPEAWYLLGDTYFHLGPQALVSQEETEEAFLRAVELDPDFTPAHIHLADMAFRLDPDSARARQRIDRYGELAPGTRIHLGLGLAFDLAFGDPTTRETARAVLDTTTLSLAVMAGTYFSHARFVEQLAAVAAEMSERDHPFAPPFEFWAGVQSGRLGQAIRALENPAFPPAARLLSLTGLNTGLAYLGADPLSPEWAQEVLEAAVADTANPVHALVGGFYAAESRREEEGARATATLRAASDRLVQAGDTVGARYAAGGARALTGLAAWRSGNLERAAELLEEARTEATASTFPGDVLNDQIRWWQARLAVERGQPREAEPYLRSLSFDPVSQLHLGRLYDDLGEPEKAIEAYRYFLTAWHDPDPRFEPLVREIRQRIAALLDAPDSS